MPQNQPLTPPNQTGYRTGWFSLPGILFTIVGVLFVTVVALSVIYVWQYSNRYITVNGGSQRVATEPEAPDCSGPDATGNTGVNVMILNRHPAGTTQAKDFLRGFQCSDVDEVIYASEYVSQGKLETWFGQAEKNGLQTSLQVNSFFMALDTSEQRIAYLKDVDQNSDIVRYCIALNGVPSNKKLDGEIPGSYTLSQWKDDIAQAVDEEPCVFGDYIPEPSPAQADVEINSSPYVPVFLPVGAPDGYGSEDDYPDIGKRINELAGVAAIGAVQAMGQDGTERPTPEEVGEFAAAMNSGPQNIVNWLLYSEEPDADNILYIGDTAEAVKEAVS